jgi:type VI secretion system secreted protein Hcp
MFDCFLQIDGIPGESTDDRHKDWIELLSYDHKVVQPTSATRSSAGGGSTGRSQHHDYVITKYVDKASPKLFEAVASGKHFSKAKIEICRAGGSQVKFMEITLEEVIISRVQQESFSAETAANIPKEKIIENFPTESVSLNYGKIEWVYTQQKRKDGSGGGNVTAKYDVTAGKA